MTDIEKYIVGKRIIKADITGFGIELTLDNKAVFEYNASDGGYSLFEIHKPPKYEAYRYRDGSYEYFDSDNLDEIEAWTTGYDTFGVWDVECDSPVA